MRFLLWHYLYCMSADGTIINPENGELCMVAFEIFCVFDSEFENAPINSKWHDAFLPEVLGEPLLYEFREYAGLVLKFGYIDISTCEYLHRNYLDILEKNDDYETVMAIQRDLRSQVIFEGHDNLLGLSSARWATLVLQQANPALGKRLSEMETVPLKYYLLADQDEDYYYMEDLKERSCNVNVTLKVSKDSFGKMPDGLPITGETVIVARFTMLDGEWNLNGVAKFDTLKDIENDEEMQSKLRMGNSISNAFLYESFLKTSGGKECVFLKNREDVVAFMKKLLGKAYTPDLIRTDIDEDTVLWCTRNDGISILPDLAACLKCADNPCYDERSAGSKAFGVMTCPDCVSHQVACTMYDKGFLDDASFNSTKGYEYGRKFIQENAQFIMDYFLHGCVENDKPQLRIVVDNT